MADKGAKSLEPWTFTEGGTLHRKAPMEVEEYRPTPRKGQLGKKRSLSPMLFAAAVLVAVIIISAAAASNIFPPELIRSFFKETTQLPEKIVTSVGSAPALSSQDASSFDLFVRGSDNALWWRHYRWNSVSEEWSNWESLGGNLTSSPAATSRTNGTIDVFARSGDGSL